MAANPGDFDPSFAGTGLVPQQFGDNTGDGDFGNGIAAQADGKSLVVGIAATNNTGEGVVARYLVDGTLDPSFGSGGRVTDPTFGPWAAAVQPDGKIVVAGEGISGGYAFARYLPNGSLDPSFGGGSGKVSVSVGPTSDARAQAVAIAPGGKIVAAGSAGDGAGAVRLNSDGTPDATFNANGRRDLGTGNGNDAEGVAVQPDGKVVIAVASGSGAGDGFTIIRLDDHGAPDGGFGTAAGTAHFAVPPGGEGRSTSVAIQPDGKIVAGGYGESLANPTEFAIARLNSDGTPDMSFSGDGRELTPMPSVGPEANGRATFIQPNGKIVLAGTTEVQAGTGKTTLAFARYDPSDGSLDSSFGDGGIRVEPLPTGWDSDGLASAALACDGKVVAEGEATVTATAHEQFLTSRILGDPIPCPGLNPPPPGATADHVRPHSRIRHIPRVIRASRLKQFAGTAADDSGVAKVEIALLRRVGKVAAFSRSKHQRPRCLWLRSGRARFKTLRPRRGKCATPRFLRANGTTKWVFKLRKRLPAGSYILYARATDTSGNAESSFGTKQGNRVAFRVKKG